jgi:hypothetical protein
MWTAAPSALDYLHTATEAARWIRSAAQQQPDGLTWLPEPDHPEKTATVSAPPTIYSGNAGIVIFLLELARATGDSAYLDEARRGAEWVATHWRETLDYRFLIALDNVNLDFNHGLSGTAFALAQAWQATGDERLREAALAVTRHVAAAVHPAGNGVAWIDAAAAGLGDGSILLFLLWAAKALNEPSLLELATRAGDHILEQGENDPRGGRKWVGFPLERLGAPSGAYMPNFEFGTAGVAFVLARLYEETGEQRFLDAARAGTEHVQRIATVRGDAALLHQREPDMTDLFYLGYCGGPVGTARLFYQMHKLTGEQGYAEWTDRFARGVMESGIPERQTPGMWNVVCQCCGTSGVVDLFIGLWAGTGKSEYLAFAERVGAALLSQATDFDGRGARWYQAWTRVKPGEVAAETGYMIGAAGVGSALLHVGLALEGRYHAILFPDNPFPRDL